MQQINVYNLMEAPYMAELLKEQRYEEFMQLLKQSEVEIATKIMEIVWKLNELEMRMEKFADRFEYIEKRVEAIDS